MLVEPGGRRYIEASGSAKPSGVRLHDMHEFIASRPEWDFRMIPHPDPHAVWELACTQVGKPYDWAFLFGWLVHRNWQHPDKWVCQELITWACKEAGYPIFPLEVADQWHTPHSLYLISKPLAYTGSPNHNGG